MNAKQFEKAKDIVAHDQALGIMKIDNPTNAIDCYMTGFAAAMAALHDVGEELGAKASFEYIDYILKNELEVK